MVEKVCMKTKNAFTTNIYHRIGRPALDYGQEKMDTISSLFHGDMINGGFHDLSHTYSFQLFESIS